MSETAEEKVEEPVSTTIRQKCVSCLKGPNLIKTVVVMVCTVVVVQQLTTCIRKLIDVPITTYTHFDFNKTIMYPSVTFCREPPYKYKKMLEYDLYAHPRHTSAWLNYNFSHSLDDLWEDITYREDEFFSQYGLDGEVDNVEIQSTMGYALGRCHTFVPKRPNVRATRGTGYSVTLQHSAEDVATSTSIFPPGYHVYVHYTREPFTEIEVNNGGLVDYLYINVGETIDVKLTVDEYSMISREDNPCIHGDGYSANICTSTCVWDMVGGRAGCSGPWMESQLPRCNNYTSMATLMTAYMNTYINHTCSLCPRFCRVCLYNAFVTDRQIMYTWDIFKKRWTVRSDGAELQSQIYMYFNSMMVSVYEERYNYDWNLFISDLGGSVGFLLGLSVISLMTITGKLWSSIIRPSIKGSKVKRADSISSSTVTAKMENNQNLYKEPDLLKKCNEWNEKNNFNGFI